jgi:hypothetical protein
LSADRELEELRIRYQGLSIHDLLRVVAASQDYRPAAVQVAREILAARDEAEVGAIAQDVRVELQDEDEEKQRLADEPLTPGLKAMCFILSGFPGIVFAAYQTSQGRTRRAREAWMWVLFGWVGAVGLFIVCHG